MSEMHVHGDDCGAFRHCERCGYPAMLHRNSDPCPVRDDDGLSDDDWLSIAESERESERLADQDWPVKLCEREGCGITFEPVRSTARFCSARCRVAAGRAEVKAAARTLERAGQFADYDEDNPYLTQVALTAAAKVAYPCCQHCPDRPHAAHADPCRQGCPAWDLVSRGARRYGYGWDGTASTALTASASWPGLTPGRPGTSAPDAYAHAEVTMARTLSGWLQRRTWRPLLRQRQAFNWRGQRLSLPGAWKRRRPWHAPAGTSSGGRAEGQPPPADTAAPTRSSAPGGSL